ncbi:MAG TPA: hypothetical protein VFF73_40815 [Planctomycetota bacterium]|nr:hypothetical protein [Planctomycetota bacterium]
MEGEVHDLESERLSRDAALDYERERRDGPVETALPLTPVGLGDRREDPALTDARILLDQGLVVVDEPSAEGGGIDEEQEGEECEYMKAAAGIPAAAL